MKFDVIFMIFTTIGSVLLVDANVQISTTNDNPIQDHLPRVERNWPFSSSQRNADMVNSYYRTKLNDDWVTKNVQKPLARYVGRSLGDEFPKVRDSIMHHQNQGMSFWQAHHPSKGYHPRNWMAYNKHNNHQERSDPYNGYNQYERKY